MLRLNHIITLCILFAFTGCGCSPEDPNKKGKDDGGKGSTPEVTKLTYTINLTNKNSDGYYIGKVGEKITIKAAATGPKKDEVKWINHTTLKRGVITDVNFINSQERGTSEEFSFTPTGPAKLIITCEPAKQETKNGVKLYEGKQEFKIEVEAST